MTLFATAYIVPDSWAASLVPEGGWSSLKSLHEALNSFSVVPGCTSPGLVVNTLLEFLAEYGIDMPADEDHPQLKTLSSLEGVVCVVSGEETSSFLRQLDRMMLMESQLGGYYEDYTGETWPEAGKEMLKVFNFIRDGLVKQQKTGGIYVLTVR